MAAQSPKLAQESTPIHDLPDQKTVGHRFDPPAPGAGATAGGSAGLAGKTVARSASDAGSIPAAAKATSAGVSKTLPAHLAKVPHAQTHKASGQAYVRIEGRVVYHHCQPVEDPLGRVTLLTRGVTGFPEHPQPSIVRNDLARLWECHTGDAL